MKNAYPRVGLELATVVSLIPARRANHLRHRGLGACGKIGWVLNDYDLITAKRLWVRVQVQPIFFI